MGKHGANGEPQRNLTSANASILLFRHLGSSVCFEQGMVSGLALTFVFHFLKQPISFWRLEVPGIRSRKKVHSQTPKLITTASTGNLACLNFYPSLKLFTACLNSLSPA